MFLPLITYPAHACGSLVSPVVCSLTGSKYGAINGCSGLASCPIATRGYVLDMSTTLLTSNENYFILQE